MNRGKSPGVLALCGGLAMYGAYFAVAEGRIKLNKYGDVRWLSWAENPTGFGLLVFSLVAVAAVLFWIAW